MKNVYVLSHSYNFGENMEYRESKMLGVYSSEKSAKNAIDKYLVLEGFRDYPIDCFCVTKYRLGEMHWTDGF